MTDITQGSGAYMRVVIATALCVINFLPPVTFAYTQTQFDVPTTAAGIIDFSPWGLSDVITPATQCTLLSNWYGPNTIGYAITNSITYLKSVDSGSTWKSSYGTSCFNGGTTYAQALAYECADPMHCDISSRLSAIGLTGDGLYRMQVEGYLSPNYFTQFTIANGLYSTTTPSVATSTPTCMQDCYSNVMFIPGIEASRLYKPRGQNCTGIITDCEDQLWEPNTDSDLVSLFMNSDGTSVRSDIYTKDILDSYPGADVYKTFEDTMDAEVASGTIREWKAAPYDWRLDLQQVVDRGVVTDGKISYTGAATSSYMIQTLLQLASSSKSGKVTIIAHSNGGLVAKLLINKLKAMGKENLIDNIVFVGVPQLGTPKAIASLLHGYDQTIGLGVIASQSTARTLALNVPAAYTLLPSAAYTSKVLTPTVIFDPQSITASTLRAHYGEKINTYSVLKDFVTGTSDNRIQPDPKDTNSPSKGNFDLLSRAEVLHTILDNWTPPASSTLYEIAGVGIDTPGGITYVDSCSIYCLFSKSYLTYKPNITLDGDGTVVEASAHASVGEKYYFNIDQYKKDTQIKIDHSTMMGAHPITAIIDDLIRKNNTLQTTYISIVPPNFANNKHLVYRIHSPVSLDFYDSIGHHTGIATTTLTDGSTHQYIQNDASGVTYDQFGEVKYAYSNGATPLHVVLRGLASGYVTYDIDEMTGNTVTASTTFVNIPVSTSTIITMDIAGSIKDASPLKIDVNGDGVVDKSLNAGGVVQFDTVAPEIQLTFSTSTQSIQVTATDDSGYATTSVATSYPILKKGEKVAKGIATTTITAKDASGNTTIFKYSEQWPAKDRRISLTPVSISYNSATSTSIFSNTLLAYKWNIKKSSYDMFATYIRTNATSTEAHYRPKKDVTILMSKPIDLDDLDDDDGSDTRPLRLQLAGMRVVGVTTEKGFIKINY
ncbi:MAG: hypothetical protein JWO50_316 [Candidatus Kaiserbacteria bacterium]|nr:hypothetical protein [Candidatus Kaiserbacteria bacterium]